MIRRLLQDEGCSVHMMDYFADFSCKKILGRVTKLLLVPTSQRGICLLMAVTARWGEFTIKLLKVVLEI